MVGFVARLFDCRSDDARLLIVVFGAPTLALVLMCVL